MIDPQPYLETWGREVLEPMAGTSPMAAIQSLALSDRGRRGSGRGYTATGQDSRARGRSAPPTLTRRHPDAVAVDAVMRVLRDVDALAYDVMVGRAVGATMRDMQSAYGRGLATLHQASRVGYAALAVGLEVGLHRH